MAEWGAQAPGGCGREVRESKQTSPHSPVLAPPVPQAVPLDLSLPLLLRCVLASLTRSAMHLMYTKRVTAVEGTLVSAVHGTWLQFKHTGLSSHAECTDPGTGVCAQHCYSWFTLFFCRLAGVSGQISVP